MEREGLVSAYRISEETTPKEGVASIPKPKMSSSSSSEEGQVDPERRLRGNKNVRLQVYVVHR